MSIDCAGEYDVAKEKTQDFNYNWSLPFKSKENLTPLNKTWWYQTRSELDAYPFLAELDTYFGSGYVVEIFPSWNNKEFLHILKEKQWIDRHTKAIIIEFTLFNAATNYFNSMTIVLEFPPGGGCIPFHSTTTFRLFRQEGSYEFITIVCEVLFLLLMILFTICEARLLYRTGWSYFKEFWNLVECNFDSSCHSIYMLIKKFLARSFCLDYPQRDLKNLSTFSLLATRTFASHMLSHLFASLSHSSS